MRGLPTRKTLHKAGPPVYEPAIPVARCAPLAIADPQPWLRTPGIASSPRATDLLACNGRPKYLLNFCDARKQNFAFAFRIAPCQL
jgi:hypothetical protein